MDPFSILAAMESTIGAVQGVITAAQGFVMMSAAASAAAAVTSIAALEFNAIIDIVLGLFGLFVGVVKSLIRLIPDSFDAIYTFITFSITWMLCLFKNIKNFQACAIYYVLDIIGNVLYLPVRITLFLLNLLGANMYPLEAQIWDFIYLLDRYCIKLTGFHFAHYPKNIRDQCYNCKRLKVAALMEHGQPLIDDITIRIPRYLNPGLDLIGQGGYQLLHPFELTAPKIDPDLFDFSME
jgi:hypothetical protein